MDNKGKRYNTRLLLYAIMAVFCILALIEIIYGRIRSQAQQEKRVAQEETVNDPIPLETVEGNTDIPDIPLQGMSESEEDNENTDKPDASEGEDKKAAEDGNDKSSEGDTKNSEKTNDMQIVFMGDSILDNVREYDGVAYLISKACNAEVYNMAIGGTTAALLEGEEFNFNNWTSISLLGVVHAILGNIDGEIFAPYRAGEILEECDFSKTDYFIIEYGVNDFLAKVPNTKYLEDGSVRDIDELHTYVGALQAAIGALQNAFPDAKIVLISPHYCQFFSGNTFLGDAYSIDYGYGPLISYANLCGYVYSENRTKNLIYFNTFADSGIDAYTAEDYLEDGIHLTAAGRHAYADCASRLILADFRKNE